jgi:hypothetical protein
MQTDHGRNPERTRQDGGVVGAAARICRKTFDSCPVELSDDGWCQFIGDEHAGGVEILQSVARPTLLVTEVHTQTAGDVIQIAFPFVQIRIVDAIEHGGRFIERPLHGPFGVDSFVPNHCRRATNENRVVEHQQLGIEDGSEVGAPRRRDAPPDLLKLSP